MDDKLNSKYKKVCAPADMLETCEYRSKPASTAQNLVRPRIWHIGSSSTPTSLYFDLYSMPG